LKIYAEAYIIKMAMAMTSGKVINFYQVIPLYPEELKMKMDSNCAEKGWRYI